MLLAPEVRSEALATEVVDRAIDIARTLGVSSLHWLFATDPPLLESARLLARMGCQFHWENRDYPSFEAFLGALTAKRRKEILRERRLVREAGVELTRERGDRVDPELWRMVHGLYCATFAKYGNYPALTEGFFRQVAATLGSRCC